MLIRRKEDSAVELIKTQAELKFLPVTQFFPKVIYNNFVLLNSPKQGVSIPPKLGEPKPLSFSTGAPQVRLHPNIGAVGASYLLFVFSKQASNKAAY